jgi:HlyD family secretion protein
MEVMSWIERGSAIQRFAHQHVGRSALVAASLLALIILIGPRLVLGPRVNVEGVVQRNFVQTVVASGRVAAPHRVSIGTQIVGTVLHVPVTEGQTVAGGALLIELESAELRAAVSQADLQVRQAQAKLRQLQEVQAPVAEQTLREAQANDNAATQALTRNRDLYAKGFIGRAALDEAERATQVSQAQVRSAQRQLDSAQPAGSDTAAARAALAQAQAGADVARARLRYALIKAPTAGTLIARDVEPGDVVQPGKELMQLAPDGEIQLVLQIDEKNLRLLKVGQRALASADAYAQQRFPAELVYINPGVNAQRGSVEVKLRVPQAPDYLMEDMTVSVDIAVAERANAILVPADALHDASGASPAVYKIEGGKAHRTPVQLGVCGNGYCEVLRGLRAGDLVVPASITALKDGMRLRSTSAKSQ